MINNSDYIRLPPRGENRAEKGEMSVYAAPKKTDSYLCSRPPRGGTHKSRSEEKRRKEKL